MASENTEDGFAQQGNGENTAWEEDGGYGATEGQQTEHDSHDQQSQEEEEVDDEEEEPTVSTDPSFNASGDAPSDAEEDGGEYDPESITMAETTPTPAVAPAAPERSTATASPRPSKKPKKAGGFIVGSSDDEDESPPPAAPASSNAPKTVPSELQSRTFTNSPLQQSTTSAEITNNSNAGAPAAQVSNGLGTASPAANASAPKPRLPTDTIGLLEDRIKDDPRGDMDAWLALIEEYRRRNIIQDTRAVYERFLKVFPQSAEIWVRYLHDELSLDNFAEAEQIFQRTLMSIPSVQLWTAYLDYIRRRNDLNDGTGQARQTVNASYEFVLDNIGQDRDSGRIWHEYIQFIKSGPGQIDGKGWQDMQKMDVLRKAYQRAICIPMSNLNLLWKEYDQFELGINKVAGRKFLQEKSPSYMSARSANTHLENITRGLQRTTLPRLPPAPGFEGDQEFLEQVDLWKRWIAWEKDDPLVLKADEPETYKARIIHVYKQALMALRFWPEMWVDAAEWCFDNNIYGKDGSDLGLPFLMEGIAANPESTLLALKHADRIESTHPAGEGEDGKAALSQAVRAPFDTVLTALYDMVKKLKEREATTVNTIQNDPTLASSRDANDGEDGDPMSKAPKASTKEDRVKAVREGFAVQIQMLSQQISYLWIALVRAFRRIQGQGKGNPPGGVRAIFTEARSKGRLTSDVYVAVAHIEWDIYQDPVATKIFERGAKLFPEDEHFMVAYLKHLHSRHDTTNARVVFSQTIKRFKEKPELAPKLKPLYLYFHGYEAKFGELAQIKELEKQMAECFPEDPTLAHFSARFASERFNPIMARVIISPAAQMRPKSIMQSVEQVPVSARASPHPSVLAERSPRLQHLQTQSVNSPKRPFQADDQEDYNPPRKLPRGASPLKGAAGRRLDQQRRAQGQGVASYSSTPAPISRDITFLLGLIPPAHQYGAQRFKPDAMVRTIRDTHVPDYSEWKNAQAQGLRNDPRGHGRQVSTDFASMMHNRNSPAPSARPDSPYTRGGMRMPPQPGVQYAHRPGSSDDYEPTQDWAQGSVPGQYGQQNFPPQHANPYMAPGAPPAGMSGYSGQPNTYYGGPQF